MKGAGASLAIAHRFRFKTHPAPPGVVYYELTLLPRALPPTPANAERVARFYEAFEEFGERSAAELGMFAWHVTPEPGQAGWGTKVEVLGQYMEDEAGFRRELGAFEALLRTKGENEYHLASRRMSEFRICRSEADN